jgi:hypothetical protein
MTLTWEVLQACWYTAHVGKRSTTHNITVSCIVKRYMCAEVQNGGRVVHIVMPRLAGNVPPLHSAVVALHGVVCVPMPVQSLHRLDSSACCAFQLCSKSCLGSLSTNAMWRRLLGERNVESAAVDICFVKIDRYGIHCWASAARMG